MSEHLLTREELEASKGATGRIVRIVGPVVDVEFPAESMPGIYNALTVDAKTLAGDMHVVLEVETHLPGNLVRSVAMSSTDGLVRGLEVLDTGHPIMMPVGNETLGRIWNVMGEPVDEKPMPDVTGYMPIHRPAPEYDQLSTRFPLPTVRSSCPRTCSSRASDRQSTLVSRFPALAAPLRPRL